MNINPIRIFGEDDDDERPQDLAPPRQINKQDEEIKLPDVPEDLPEDVDKEFFDDIAGGDDLGKGELNACEPKKNNLFGKLPEEREPAKKTSIPVIYVAMALGLIKFMY